MPFLCGAGAHHQIQPAQKVDMDQPHSAQSADQHHPPSLGLEPPEQAEKKKTSSDEEKNPAGKKCTRFLRVCAARDIKMIGSVQELEFVFVTNYCKKLKLRCFDTVLFRAIHNIFREHFNSFSVNNPKVAQLSH